MGAVLYGMHRLELKILSSRLTYLPIKVLLKSQQIGTNMTVQDLIDEMLFACGGKDPKEIEVKKVVTSTESEWGFGEEWEEPRVDAVGGNEYPRVVLIK
jgi:hypothetical protein